MVGSNITIRVAGPDDAMAMERCAARAYADVLNRLEGLPDVVGGMAGELEVLSGLVAMSGDRLAGFVLYGATGEAVKVANLACDPDFAGRGVARTLLAAVADAARAAGKVRLDLVTHKDMVETQAFYRHLGWHEVGQAGQGVQFTLAL